MNKAIVLQSSLTIFAKWQNNAEMISEVWPQKLAIKKIAGRMRSNIKS